MPTITQLEYVVSVDKWRHFGRAASECFVSQPSLSEQIHKLEAEIGYKLFDRSKKPVVTTDLGKPFLVQARHVLREYSQLLSMPSGSDSVEGAFHLAVIPSVLPYLLPRFLASFSRLYPKVELTVSELKTNDMIRELNEEAVDAGIAALPLATPGLFEETLYREPFYLFVSAKHSLLSRPSRVMNESDLASVGPLWLLAEGHCFRDQALRVCGQQATRGVLPNVSFSGGSLETLIQLVRNGEGATLLPYLATLGLSKVERDAQLFSISPAPSREIGILVSRRYPKQSVLTALSSSVLAGVSSLDMISI